MTAAVQTRTRSTAQPTGKQRLRLWLRRRSKGWFGDDTRCDRADFDRARHGDARRHLGRGVALDRDAELGGGYASRGASG